jgi:type I restriction enzyme, R subunit
MTTDIREQAFERAIEHALLQHGYRKGLPGEFDASLGLFPSRLLDFIRDTQLNAWQALCKIHGASVEQNVIHAITRAIQAHPKGLIGLLRDSAQGKFKDRGIPIRLFFLKPDNDLNPDAKNNYNKNRLTVTRQVRYSTKNGNSLDMVIDLNGFPLITMELKNPLTGQAVKNAINQYKNDRDPSELIFRFNERALVHFAVDPDEVFMTTKLDKKDTFFLPFNKGNGFGKGNPSNLDGYKTSYLWEQVLAPDSLFDLLQKFIELQVKEETKKGKKIKKSQLIFPRYHQFDAVNKIEAHAKANGTGHRYLIQHSAGSGKSNTLGWTAYRLASVADAAGNAIFNSVIVVTDRVVLDQQLQETIRQFDATPGFVAYIDKDSAQLANALTKGSKIIITTLQKFPFVIGKLNELPKDHTYAVIMDEAHSSQTGTVAKKTKDILSYKGLSDAQVQDAMEDQEVDVDEQIAQIMAEYNRKKNLSLFAFTATPKKKTMEMFGTPGPDGKPIPFHLYSMRQAIEEGFIHDVLKKYTTYKTYFEITKKIEDDPDVERRKTARGVARFVELHPTNLSQKAEIIIEHFRQHIRYRIGGAAKAMVVTSSRLHAKRYMQAIQDYIKKKGYNLGVLVAFSGKIDDHELDELGVTEASMNQFPDTQTAEAFHDGRDDQEYHLMIVADKYQTGFDEPRLYAMYVDKKLTGIKAVQTLSRLNRTCPGKDGTFVLDFVNERETILKAFQPYYEQTEIDAPTDPNIVYDFQRLLDQKHIYTDQEIEAVCKVYFDPAWKQTKAHHARLYKELALPEQRFDALSEEEQDDALALMKKFISVYLFLSQLIEYGEEMKRYYTFIRFLHEKLRVKNIANSVFFFNSNLVDLEYYRLKMMEEGAIELEQGAEAPLTGHSKATGKGKSEDEYKPLSEIVKLINERFGTNLDPDTVGQQLHTVAETFGNMPGMEQQAKNNSFDDFMSPFADQFIDGMVDSVMSQKDQLNHENDQLDKLVEFISASDEGCQMISDAVGRLVYNMLKK